MLAARFANYARFIVMVLIADVKTICILDYEIGSHFLCSKKKVAYYCTNGSPVRGGA